jgi:hypothetical protein
MKKLILISFIALLAACQPVRETHQVAQPTGQALQAKPGDTILTIVKEKSLPSEIVKGADLLGRKTMTGLTTLEYRGVEGNRAVFKQRTMRMESLATDLNPSRKPTVQSDGDKNIFVNLTQGRKVVVVESRTVMIDRADNFGLFYSIVEPPKPAAAVPEQAAAVAEPEPEVPFKRVIRGASYGNIRK